jgi:transglutaminase-like putative cysteine protease
VRSVQRWLKQNYSYEFAAGNYKSVDQLLSTRHAECNGYSSTAAALLRAMGVPTRVVWVLNKAPTIAPPGHLKGHVIIEVWLSGPNCWVPFEPQLVQTAGVYDVIRMCFQTPGIPWLSEAFMQADGDMPAYTEKPAAIMSIR